MNEKEYLCMFSGEGSIKVNVKFNDNRFVANQKMRAEEIAQLVSRNGNKFIHSITTDECLVNVKKYVIDPKKNTLTIHVE